MIKLFLVSTFLVCVYGATLEFKPLVLRDFPQRIVGGQPIEITDAPYQVALLYDKSNNGVYGLMCGGSIAGESLIVTAGHCITSTVDTRWKIRAGSKNYFQDGQLINVTSVKRHEKYNAYTIDYDVAVMRLVSPIEIDNETTKIIPLAPTGLVVKDNSTALTSGWGATISGGVVGPDLRQVSMKIINQELCKEAYEGFNDVTDNMICAGNYEQGGQDACQGDSGGPMVVDGVLVGITSWGKGCAVRRNPGVWSRVSALRSWIDENSY